MNFASIPSPRNCVSLISYFVDEEYDFVDFFVRSIRAIDNLRPLYSISAEEGLKVLAVACFNYDVLNSSDFEGHLRRVCDRLVSGQRIQEEYDAACKDLMS